MQRVVTALLVLAISLPAAVAGWDAADLGSTLSLRRGLLSADKLLQAASKIFTGAVPKKDFQKVLTSSAEAVQYPLLCLPHGDYMSATGADVHILLCRAVSTMVSTASCQRAPGSRSQPSATRSAQPNTRWYCNVVCLPRPPQRGVPTASQRPMNVERRPLPRWTSRRFESRPTRGTTFAFAPQTVRPSKYVRCGR